MHISTNRQEKIALVASLIWMLLEHCRITVNGPNPLLALLRSIFVFTRKDYLQILPLVIKARKPMESSPTGSNVSD